jgi:hypothetical protein
MVIQPEKSLTEKNHLQLALTVIYTRLLLRYTYVIATGKQKLVDNVHKRTLVFLSDRPTLIAGTLNAVYRHLLMLTEMLNMVALIPVIQSGKQRH